MRETLASRHREWKRLLEAYDEARVRFLRTHEGERGTDGGKEESSLSPEVMEYNEFLNSLRRQPKEWLRDVAKGFEKRIVSIPGTVAVNEESLLCWSGYNLRKLGQWEEFTSRARQACSTRIHAPFALRVLSLARRHLRRGKQNFWRCGKPPIGSGRKSGARGEHLPAATTSWLPVLSRRKRRF